MQIVQLPASDLDSSCRSVSGIGTPNSLSMVILLSIGEFVQIIRRLALFTIIPESQISYLTLRCTVPILKMLSQVKILLFLCSGQNAFNHSEFLLSRILKFFTAISIYFPIKEEEHYICLTVSYLYKYSFQQSHKVGVSRVLETRSLKISRSTNPTDEQFVVKNKIVHRKGASDSTTNL